MTATKAYDKLISNLINMFSVLAPGLTADDRRVAQEEFLAALKEVKQEKSLDEVLGILEGAFSVISFFIETSGDKDHPDATWVSSILSERR